MGAVSGAVGTRGDGEAEFQLTEEDRTERNADMLQGLGSSSTGHFSLLSQLAGSVIQQLTRLKNHS